MKIILKLSFFLLFAFISSTIGQEYPAQADKEMFISYLDSLDDNIHLQGIRAIRFYHITEAIPAIEERLWQEDEITQSLYLRLLVELGSPNMESFALAYIDSAANDSSRSPLLKKVDATRALFLAGNFSTIDYYWEWLDEFKNGKYETSVGFLHALPEIIRNVPEDAERAKTELIYYAQHSKNEGVRYTAITNLGKLYGDEMISLLLEIANTESSSGNRYAAYEELVKLDYSDLHNYTKERLYTEPESLYRVYHADTLLVRYGSIDDYKYVNDYLQLERDAEKKDWIKIGIDIYYPPKPDSLVVVYTMLDTLTSYTNQCYSYDWLKDVTYKNELINKITTAKNYLTANDSLACRNEVSLFQNSVNQVYQDSAGSYPKYVSDAGYKFLYYYAQYILDRLPEPAAGLPVKLKDSQGNLLQGGSLQYYKGSRKDAVNIGDGTFNVITERTAVK